MDPMAYCLPDGNELINPALISYRCFPSGLPLTDIDTHQFIRLNYSVTQNFRNIYVPFSIWQLVSIKFML